MARANPMYMPPDSAFIRECLGLADQKAPKTVPYGTDGTMFNEMKHLVVFGPGDIAQAHTHDEWIALDCAYPSACSL
jgi:acetylornithine deacetylase/succinyl-diaminopimelate desuccinylase-like protein